MPLSFGDPVWLHHVPVSTPGEAFYVVKEFLKTATWTVKGSGDGLSAYSATDDILTDGTTGANGCDNVNAWIRLGCPDGQREITIQLRTTTVGLTASDGCTRIKYSVAAGFTGGSPGASQTPSATDEQLIKGGGTDASPTSTKFFTMHSSGGAYFFGGADRVTPFGFYVAGIQAYSGFGSCFAFALCPIVGYQEAETDPYVWVADGGNDVVWTLTGNGTISSDSETVRGFKPGDTTAWRALGGYTLLASSYFTDGLDTIAGGVLGIPIWHMEVAGDYGKGWNAILLATTEDTGSGAERLHFYNDPTLGARRYIRLGDQSSPASLAAPWDGSSIGTLDPGDVPFSTVGTLHILTDILGEVPDEEAPTIVNMSPAPGALVSRSQPIEFDVLDPTPGLRLVLLALKYTDRAETCLIYDGSEFLFPFAGGSTIAPITSGYHVELVPQPAWLGDFRLRVFAVDAAGNLEGAS